MRARGMGLYNGDAIIVVDYQSRQAIAFAVDNPEAIGMCGGKACRKTGAERAGKALLIEIFRRWRGIKTQKPYGDASVLVVAIPQHFAAAVDDVNPNPVIDVTFHFFKRAGKNPGMESTEGNLLAFLQYNPS